jgi:NitT/TauT family transport system substrate-binding protein
MKRMAMKSIFALALAAACVLGPAGTALAEANRIQVARQPGLSFLPLMVIEDRKLIERHAKSLGLGDVEVTWLRFNSGAAMIDAALSGNLDVAASGVPPLVTIWARTKGNADVRGIAALNSIPLTLNTTNRNMKSIEDIGEGDRIAIPAVKVSVQAVILQMAAAKKWGQDQYTRLDRHTVSMSHPDGTIALLSGRSEITAHMSGPPFQNQQLEDPRVQKVFSSYDVVGGPATTNVVWTTSKFHRENPKLYKAFLAALSEAQDIINGDFKAAAQLYVRVDKSKLAPEFIERILSDPQLRFTVVPENTMRFANFMHAIGSVKQKPDSWKDLFFPELHDRPGS